MGLTLQQAFDREGVAENHQKSIREYLHILRNRDESTYRHALRVGILASEIARRADYPGITSKMLLWAGLLHDVGKTMVPPELLKKKGKFSSEDYEQVKPHAEYGWKLLQQVYDYTAHIIVRHHHFGPNPYPEKLPELTDFLKSKGVAIEMSARILALADFYDALMTRENDKFGGKLSPEQRRKTFFEANSDMHELISYLETSGVIDFEKNREDVEDSY